MRMSETGRRLSYNDKAGLLALKYGADIVYTEEIIDIRLLASERVENKLLGTINYIDRRDNSTS